MERPAATLPPDPASALPRPPSFPNLRQMFQARELVILAVLLAELVYFGLQNPGFVSASNLFSAARFVSITGIAAIGASLVIILGGIDLSVGAVYGFCGVFFTWMVTRETPVPAWAGLLATLLVGTAFGVLNGTLIARLRLPPFIVTLGTLGIAAGLALYVTGGQNLPSDQSPFRPDMERLLGVLYSHFFARRPHFIGVNLGFFVMVAVALWAAWFLVATPTGRYIQAIGGNEEASRFSGVPVERVRVFTYGLAGLLAAVSGIFYVATYKGINSGIGRGDELDIIAACVVGGVSLQGGRGSPIGAIIGALIIKLLRDGLIQLNYSQAVALITIGAFIIVAAAADRLLRALAARRGA